MEGYEDLEVVAELSEKGDYAISFDLKSGYHHIDIAKQPWNYLGFSWVFGRKRRYYVFKVLPFGLVTAHYSFTKLHRPLVRYWRGQGMRVIMYLDDGLCLS